MDARAREKEAFFNELYQLDNTDNEDEKPSPLEAFIHRTTPEQIALACPTNPPPSIHRLSRTVSAPAPTTSPPHSTHTSTSVVEETPVPSQLHILPSSLDMSAARPGPTSKSFPAPEKAKKTPKSGAKRKRGQSFEELPESQKIFTGLSLYYLPNNDVDPARRLRIRKAMERGALWVREWRDDVTHVVVDKKLNYGHLTKFLKIPALPAKIILVNETYPSDCISYRALVNPDQPQYHVDGYKEAQNTSEPTPVASSEQSLVLKLDRGAFARGPQTPSRTESEQESLRQHLKEAEERALEGQRQLVEQAESKRTHDALDDAIAEAMTIKDLPLDMDGDENSEHDTVAEDSDASDSDKGRPTKKAKHKKSSDDQSWQQNFTCMQKHDGLNNDQNPNHRTIEILQQMADHYGRLKDQWRVTAYRKAISALRKQSVKIMSKEHAFTIPFIGQRLAAKIEEIAWTYRLRRLDNANLEPSDATLQTFLNIYGVGPVQASTWVDQGYRTLSDLTAHAHLTANQKVGIAHYNDFLSRIPRAEVEHHGKLVRDVLRKIDPAIQLIIGGSYRRGAATSGDIDFIVTKPSATSTELHALITLRAIPLLFSSGYLKATLAATSKADGSKWHGAASVPGSGLWRRVDFLLVPWAEMGAALIYFTGNDIFNRSIRLLASRKGYRLNQRGLWRDVMRGPGRARVTQGSLVEGASERRIFEVLGVPFRRPKERIC